LYREHYVNVTKSSPDAGLGNRPLGRGFYPDALVPFLDPATGQHTAGRIPSAPFDVTANSNQPVWIDLYVPQDARPGLYTGTVHVTADRIDATVPLTLHVWGFSLPVQPTLKSSFGLHEPQLTNRQIHELLLRHRVMPISVNPDDAAQLKAQLGLNSSALRFWGNSDRRSCTMDSPPDPVQILAASRRYPQDLPLYVYPADEIDPCPNLFDTVRRWATTVRSADARIKNLVTVSPVSTLYASGTGERSVVDIWTLLPKNYESASDGVAAVRAKGDEIWSYTALVQDDYSPKWEIDFAPINYRIQPGFISQSLGLTGILYWRVDLWSKAPWEDVQPYELERNTYPGEGMLIYPGGDAGISSAVPSMRLKWVRKGVEDYEYVAILKRLGHGEWAINQIHRAATDWKTWTREVSLLESVRRDLGNEIERLSCLPGTEKSLCPPAP
jgi:hypothetical protein